MQVPSAHTLASHSLSDVSNAMAVQFFRSFILVFVLSLTQNVVMADNASTDKPDLSLIEYKLAQAQKQLSETVIKMRDAKQNVTEKEMDVKKRQAEFSQQASVIHSTRLDYAKQRLQLAQMGVDTTSATFERIQARMEELAEAKLALLNSKSNNQKREVSNNATSHVAQSNLPSQLLQLPASQSTLGSLQDNEQLDPVFAHHGKLTNSEVVADELQKLERHLVTAEAPTQIAQSVKVYGTTIAGELELSDLGANQFFTRFTATTDESQLVIGAKFDDYVRTSVEVEFSEDEIGKEFILILDVNSTVSPKAIVFESSLMPGKEAFAAYQRF